MAGHCAQKGQQCQIGLQASILTSFFSSTSLYEFLKAFVACSFKIQLL